MAVISSWWRLKRVISGTPVPGGDEEKRGPLLWLGAICCEGPAVDTNHFYAARITNDARKVGRWVWAVSKRQNLTFWWPLPLQDGFRRTTAVTGHAATVLYV